MNYARWYIILIRKNSEQVILNHVRNNIAEKFPGKILDLEFFRYKNKKNQVKNALPGYMFLNCYIDEQIIDSLRSIVEVIDLLSSDSSAKSITNLSYLKAKSENFFELMKKIGIKKVIERKNRFKNFPFSVNDIVIVNEGIFKGIKGVIKNINKEFLILDVKILGRITPININYFYCKKT